MKPTWTVRLGGDGSGSCEHVYYTPYHAAQFMRALRLNGTAYELIEQDVTPEASLVGLFS